jgi:hypothetical protein
MGDTMIINYKSVPFVPSGRSGKKDLVQGFVTITVIENVVSLPVTGSQERI